jgi:hypothetical protein
MNPRDEALLGLQNLVEGRFKTLVELHKGLRTENWGLHRQLGAACERIHVLESMVRQHSERIEQLEAIIESIGPAVEAERVVDLAGDEVDLGKLATDNNWTENDSGINLGEVPPRP